jgi:hypothetical protein
VSDSGLRPDVETLIIQHIDSVEQLEVLLLLRRDTQQTWDAEMVARELRIAASSAQRRLQDLFGRGLLIRNEDERYRYSRSSPLDAAVHGLEQAFNERPVSVISFIFSRPSDNLRMFSDAFKLRKKDEE